MQDIIVVGSGFSGSILARKIAEELDRKVLVVESRGHSGGNAYDKVDEHGILVQQYGPHFINTDKYEIIKFLSRYGELFPHWVKLVSQIDGKYVRLPFNFQTVQELVGPEKAEHLLRALRFSFRGRDRVPVLELVQHANADIRAFGNLLFEKAYRTYTAKMWGIGVEEIDPYVLERVPMAMSYDERYLNKDFQYLPKNGFHEIFEHMLDHPNIEVRYHTDAMEHLTLDEAAGTVCYDGEAVRCLIFTGAIDELFGYCYGELPYRSLDIRYEHCDAENVLPCEIVSYPQAEGFTRRTEYRRFMYSQSGAEGSVVATEYPMDFDRNGEIGNIRYYPVNTAASGMLYRKYLKEKEKFSSIFLCGRLAEFKYYNMDVCIEHALKYFQQVRTYLEQHPQA